MVSIAKSEVKEADIKDKAEMSLALRNRNSRKMFVMELLGNK